MIIKRIKQILCQKRRQSASRDCNCIVFEDSVAGIKAANQAGMTSIGIGDSSILNEAKYNFKNFKELNNAFLDQLIKNIK